MLKQRYVGPATLTALAAGTLLRRARKHRAAHARHRRVFGGRLHH